MSDAGTLDGDWLLVMDEQGGSDAPSERFTISGAEVRSEQGPTALLDLADGQASFDLQDGRRISIALHDTAANQFSATVTERNGEDEWSDPASWVRA